MNGLMMHCGGDKVSYDQVCAIQPPAHTQSWKPVPYRDAIDYMRAQADRILGLEIESEEYGLNKAGDQMFAVMTLKTDRVDNGLAIGLRQSYNKSLSLGVAIGAQVFVCDNLAFSGSAFKVLRRNTTNVWSDFRALLTTQISNALGHYDAVNAEVDHMRAIPTAERRGYAILGVALGEGVLTPTQATVAFEDWKRPRHQEFSERNLYALYQCVTEGLKKGAPARLLDRHARAHAFFTEMQAA